MYKVIENRLKYLKEDLSIYNIRAGLSISKKAPKVSVFKPATAKYLIEKYLNEYTEIFDPCCGFSGLGEGLFPHRPGIERRRRLYRIIGSIVKTASADAEAVLFMSCPAEAVRGQ